MSLQSAAGASGRGYGTAAIGTPGSAALIASYVWIRALNTPGKLSVNSDLIVSQLPGAMHASPIVANPASLPPMLTMTSDGWNAGSCCWIVRTWSSCVPGSPVCGKPSPVDGRMLYVRAPEHARNATCWNRRPGPAASAAYAVGARRHSSRPPSSVPLKYVAAPSPDMYESPSASSVDCPVAEVALTHPGVDTSGVAAPINARTPTTMRTSACVSDATAVMSTTAPAAARPASAHELPTTPASTTIATASATPMPVTTYATRGRGASRSSRCSDVRFSPTGISTSDATPSTASTAI